MTAPGHSTLEMEMPMSKMTTNQKALRAFQFLLGTRDSRIRQCLQPHGFDQDEVEKGCTLLRRVAAEPVVHQPQSTRDTLIVKACNGWRVHWFTIAHATLRQRYPDVHAWLFKGLQPARTGSSLISSVRTFVKRIRQLASGKASVAKAQRARDLLATRGLTEAVLAEVDPWLKHRVGSAGELSPVTSLPTDRASDLAELWNWYLEWSGVARAVIHDRMLARTWFPSAASG